MPCLLPRFGGVAQMAELVDAQVSGICGSNVVEVRVFFWAPSFLISFYFPHLVPLILTTP